MKTEYPKLKNNDFYLVFYRIHIIMWNLCHCNVAILDPKDYN